jgi:E3 ubiquitin-protein ligase SIAH1
MDVDCVSLPEALAPAAVDVDDAGLGLGTLITATRAYPEGGANTGDMHELLECPIYTNSTFPPNHQVRSPRSYFLLLLISLTSALFDWIFALELSSL